MYIDRRVREELSRALGECNYQRAEADMDYQDYLENLRRAVAGSPLSYRPERDWQGLLIALVYAAAAAVVCYMTRGGRL